MLFSPFLSTSKDIEISDDVYLCSVVFSLEQIRELNFARSLVPIKKVNLPFLLFQSQFSNEEQ